MKKIIIALVALTILTSCSSQKQFNGFDKAEVITEIAVFDYVPIYQSYLPEPFRIIDKATEITELTMIINRSTSTDKKRDASELMGGPGTFTYQIRFNGNSLKISQIYILIDKDNVYISSLDLFDQTKNQYDLYQIQKADINAFLNYLSEQS
jgi:hypothetical protein